MTEYAFDLRLLAAIRVQADTEQEARLNLRTALDCADTNFGAWPDGSPVLGEVSMDGEADLFEVDGEEVDDEDSIVDWQFEVANGDNRLGFDAWRKAQAEAEAGA